ncbi:MAG: hypothetical protein ACYDD0_08435 [Candidatus Dormibacteria bacterium]
MQVLSQRSEHRSDSRRLCRGSAQQVGKGDSLRSHEVDRSMHGGLRREIAEMGEVAEHLKVRNHNG